MVTEELRSLNPWGIESISCIVLEGYKPATAAHQSFVLNNERDQLNNIEIAVHIKKMKETFGYSHKDLEMMGYGSKATISKWLTLLTLPNEVKDQIASGELTKAHGEVLLKLGDPKKIKKTADMAISGEWSARQTNTTVEQHLKKAQKAAEKQAPAEKISDQEVPGVYFKDAKSMSELPVESTGLIVTSPPYNVGMEFEKGVSYDEHIGNITAVLAECARVLVAGGTMCINVGDILKFRGVKGNNSFTQIQPMAHIYPKMLRKHGVYLIDQIIWVKDSTPFTQDVSAIYSEKTRHTEYRIITRHEPVLIFRKNGVRSAPSEAVELESRLSREEWKMYAPSVWKIDRVRKTDGHPTIFPDELVARLIKMYPYIGETVLDPFLGSGTTVKVARELGRDGVGYERDLRYKGTIMKRLGVMEEVKPETVRKFFRGTMEEPEASQPKPSEAEAKQPGDPKVELMMRDGMEEYIEQLLATEETVTA